MPLLREMPARELWQLYAYYISMLSVFLAENQRIFPLLTVTTTLNFGEISLFSLVSCGY